MVFPLVIFLLIVGSLIEIFLVAKIKNFNQEIWVKAGSPHLFWNGLRNLYFSYIFILSGKYRKLDLPGDISVLCHLDRLIITFLWATIMYMISLNFYGT